VIWTSARVAEWQRTGTRPLVAVWTPVQTAHFLNAIRGHRLYAAYRLIAPPFPPGWGRPGSHCPG